MMYYRRKRRKEHAAKILCLQCKFPLNVDPESMLKEQILKCKDYIELILKLEDQKQDVSNIVF